MLQFILGVICLVLAVMCRALYKTYRHTPERELKRLARAGDDLAALLYRPVAYGFSLQILLTILGAVFGVLGFGLFVAALSFWLAVISLIILVVLVGIFLVPSDGLNRGGVWMAARLAPLLAWLLERLNPVIDFVARFIRKHRPLRIHTGLYEKADLADLLEGQLHQPDNRIAPGEIELLLHALRFGDKLVTECLVPKRVVRSVGAEDQVGPVLMGELHTSGFSRFPVRDIAEPDHIVGILYLRDLILKKHTGKVAQVMKPDVMYVHEDFTLYQTLSAFLKTKLQLFIVVNSFEEFVGIITIEDVLEQIIGKPIVDEFDQFDDLRAVAAAAAKLEHTSHGKAKSEPQATTETTEVVN